MNYLTIFILSSISQLLLTYITDAYTGLICGITIYMTLYGRESINEDDKEENEQGTLLQSDKK